MHIYIILTTLIKYITSLASLNVVYRYQNSQKLAVFNFHD